MRKNSFKQAVGILFVFDNLTKIMNFTRNIVISIVLGFTKITDSFNYAMSITNTFFGLISDALLAGIIPFLIDREDKQSKINFIYSLFIILFLFFSLVTILILLNFDSIIGFIAPGFSEEHSGYIFLFFLLLVPSAILNIFIKSVDGYFRSEQIFGIPNVANFISSVIVIVLMILLLDKNIMYLAICPLIGTVISFLIFFTMIPKKMTAFDKEVFALLRFALPLIIGGSIGVINNFVDKGFATTISEGHLTILDYAYKITLQTRSMIAGPIAGAIFAFISKEISQGNIDAVQIRLNKIVNLFVVTFIFIILSYQFLGKFALELLFLHGNVNTENTMLLYQITMIYFPIVIFASIQSVIITIFYSLKKTIFPTVLSILSMILNMILNYIFVKYFGAFALASSTLLVSLIHTIGCSIYLSKYQNIHSLNIKHISISLILIISIYVYLLFPESKWFLFSITTVLIIVLLHVFKVLLIKEIIETIQNKARKLLWSNK